MSNRTSNPLKGSIHPRLMKPVILCFVMGIGFPAAFWGFNGAALPLLFSGQWVTAEVTAVQPMKKPMAMVRYQWEENGEKRTGGLKISQKRLVPKNEVGDTIHVLIDSKNPSRQKLNFLIPPWHFLITNGIGLVFFSLGLTIILWNPVRIWLQNREIEEQLKPNEAQSTEATSTEASRKDTNPKRRERY